jgi:signal transduction histidine kinase
VVEALSNVRRHTVSERATLRLDCLTDALVLQIENDEQTEQVVPPFTPRSITERVAVLGGKTFVETGEGGRTLVRVEIPL